MSKFADYETTTTYRRRRKALDERQAKSLAKDLSGERKGGIEELRTIPGFVESEPSIRKENALHLAMMEAKKRSGLTQTEIAAPKGKYALFLRYQGTGVIELREIGFDNK